MLCFKSLLLPEPLVLLFLLLPAHPQCFHGITEYPEMEGTVRTIECNSWLHRGPPSNAFLSLGSSAPAGAVCAFYIAVASALSSDLSSRGMCRVSLLLCFCKPSVCCGLWEALHHLLHGTCSPASELGSGMNELRSVAPFHLLLISNGLCFEILSAGLSVLAEGCPAACSPPGACLAGEDELVLLFEVALP